MINNLILSVIISTINIGVAGYKKARVRSHIFCKRRKSFFTKYACFILSCIFILIVPILILNLLYNFLNENNIVFYMGVTGCVCYIIFAVIINIMQCAKRIFISKRSSKLLEFFMINGVIIICIISSILMCLQLPQFIINSVFSCVLVFEFIGFIVFDDNLIYKYNKCTLILDDKSIIKNILTSSIRIKGKWLIYDDSETEIRILNAKIKK